VSRESIHLRYLLSAGVQLTQSTHQIQRNFAYSTQDVREAYACIKEALVDTRIKKVVFILHSQGGIEGGLILDWLFAEVSRSALHHLEVS
jgi:hypothetical protein